MTRQSLIETALGSVYTRDGKTEGTMVESLARYLDEAWDRIAARAKENDSDHWHEVMLVIWVWFPGGGTAEIAAKRVMDAVTGHGTWVDTVRQALNG